MSLQVLTERYTWDEASIVKEGGGYDPNGKPRDLFLKGVFLQAEVKNHNGRVYPKEEIERAVNHLNELISKGETIWGEADHPEGLQINLDRISHMVTDMWMEGNHGKGKLKIVPTPLGNLVRTLIEAGGKLGVSSRGAGSVDSLSGRVKNFQIVTIDIVARPSGPDCYPSPVYERRIHDIFNHKRSGYIEDLACNSHEDPRAREILKEEIKHWLIHAFR